MGAALALRSILPVENCLLGAVGIVPLGRAPRSTAEMGPIKATMPERERGLPAPIWWRFCAQVPTPRDHGANANPKRGSSASALKSRREGRARLPHPEMAVKALARQGIARRRALASGNETGDGMATVARRRRQLG